MWKKLALSGFALLLLAASNLRLCCRMQAGGRDLEGCYSLRDADRAAEAGALVDKLFDGSPDLLFASLLGGKRLTHEQIQRLRTWIDEQE